ncbi:chromosome segregation protein SMC [Coraliomargarita sp. SDUM461003]|uniref:Chromosome partition protein Smc n=1 Tax=Thalassobacterium maritimum TaxID=3041265 RepID=A0ABU1ARM5_9BACT|nr:chromosome segregation protein SMC [Coraliomargarita sp. SDUM461003]MDQ8206806.1 chromosome segregation protein SMC [Coraliomargarita sp. SDUM461003]
MYLKEIVISGFKSFADRTRLDLRQGVTAVVGPNGCGKSNIVDAIRWVLGEQSAKALRGASMQDVIFEGTDKRKGLPTCEVKLTFTDCEAELGTQFNEVAISRRVSRDGGSDYYINGKVSRLKDIQRLFANTGVGRVSYSFMLQGQIDQILSTNPAERRTIFEEAAGITLYKAQRKEALSKLALVDANLARVTDVIDEVSRQIGSLKRQASKALRYQRIKHRLTHLDLAYSAYRHSDLSQSITQLAERASGLRKQVEAHTGSLERDESILMEKKAQRAGLAQKMEELQQRVYNLRSEKENADNQSEFSTIRSKDMVARISEYQKEIADLEQQKAELATRAKDESENKQMHLEVVDDSDRIFRERNQELAAAQEQLAAMEGQLKKRRQDLLTAENRINRARSRCTTLEVDLKTYQVKHASLTESALNLKEEVVALEQGLAEVQGLLERRRAEQASSEQAVEEARADSREILTQYRSLQERIQEQDRGIARKTAQLNVLESLQAKFEGFGEGAKAILGDKLHDVVSQDRVSIISKELKVDSTYTTALKTLLGSAADALYIGDSATALSVIGKLDADFLGRACLQIDLPPGRAVAVGELPAGLVAAADVVTVRDAKLQAPVDRLLSGCYFADSLESFLTYWQAQPDFDFLLVATRDGETVDCRGLIHGGRTTGKKSSSVLERESEIRSLRQEIGAERAALEELRGQAETLEERRNVAEATVEAQRKRLGDLASEVSGLVAEERNQRQKIEQNARTRSQAEDEIFRLDEKHGDSITELENAREELAGAEQSLKDERQGGSDLEAAIDEARQQRDARREALSDVRLELAEKKQRLESVDRALSEVQRETASLEHRIVRRHQEIDTINEQIAQLKQSSEHQANKSVELAKTLAIANDELDKDREQLQGIDAVINEIDEGLAGRRNESRGLDKDLTKLEIRLAEERSQLGFIQNTALEEYQIDLSQVDWKAELWEGNVEFEKRVNLDELDDPDQLAAQPKQERRDPSEEELAEMDHTDWSTIETEVGELKGRISNMGPVNLDAISEYADLKDRHDFLLSQSEDLNHSKNKLVETIDEINETSQALFRDTFEQVKKNFAFTYGKISGGGDSDLVLVDSDDPLESGIDIIARPPGTRLKSVTLLSGGQRTMAAVALLFAIYMVKPSPFCVLDEIDAALDDANIGRFCDTLHGFTDKSQFLIITHNKRTISNADTVFGVTMPEKGVSTLLSMRFNKDHKRPEIAADENQQPF